MKNNKGSLLSWGKSLLFGSGTKISLLKTKSDLFDETDADDSLFGHLDSYHGIIMNNPQNENMNINTEGD